MNRKLIITSDGSHTVEATELATHYHSIHGALQESMHVFIRAGLEYFLQKNRKRNVAVFEMGFGTGLNALMSLQVAIQKQITVHYTTVELFPLKKEEYSLLNYSKLLPQSFEEDYLQELHSCGWGKDEIIHPYFIVRKINTSILEMLMNRNFDVVYYDAFDASVQPELWQVSLFEKIFKAMNGGGVFVTYSSKGYVRRALQDVGFGVEKIPGPPKKREMLRGIKQSC
ncbi:hypothetical protein A9P82_07105 [Arachidicoccus ginsenosidimutans]|uniref:tRNA (5-methylaminomethyl-2-thiouridine)(34)-methyltransferase MnmD n=1 Tax=Arachidicoccus sp. BS20 TaxID=1850526 RepID=UPI0007F14A14|nr:tRNA (5-methylaminomethyl-2-thiouridine)(34)-methyltransferase MnmD [Arachidicoccus sp. BS20]ANI89077.1 hypothetical protein A9P82_07105 [Arachidicoccus sp. BS20]